MAQLNLVVTPSFEAALERLMRRRGFANKSEAVRTVVEEAAGIEETPEEIRMRRRAVLEKMWGLYADHQGPDFPRKSDGTVDWKAVKEEIHEGMP